MVKKSGVILVILIIAVLLWNFQQSSDQIVVQTANKAQKPAVVDVAIASEDPQPEQEQPNVTTKSSPLEHSPNTPIKASELCLLIGDKSDDRITAFYQRYSYLGLTKAELDEYVEMLRKSGLINGLLQNENVIDQQQQELVEQEKDNNADIAMRQRAANKKLLDSYQYREGAFYDYDGKNFHQALIEFVAAYRDQADEALPLLYLHFKSAQRHYWRNERHPDWRIFAGFEHHRQALIYWILIYGSEKDIQQLYADRMMLSTINRHTGEMDRGYGGVYTPRVLDAIEFYREHFNFAAINREARSEPVNYDGGNSTSYLPEDDSEVGRYFNRMRKNNLGSALGEITLILSRECQI